MSYELRQTVWGTTHIVRRGAMSDSGQRYRCGADVYPEDVMVNERGWLSDLEDDTMCKRCLKNIEVMNRLRGQR